MRYDHLGRIGLLIVAFLVILMIVSSIMGTIDRARSGKSTSYLGIGSKDSTSGFRWSAFIVLSFIFIAAIAYFVFFIGNKRNPRF